MRDKDWTYDKYVTGVAEHERDRSSLYTGTPNIEEFYLFKNENERALCAWTEGIFEHMRKKRGSGR